MKELLGDIIALLLLLALGVLICLITISVHIDDNKCSSPPSKTQSENIVQSHPIEYTDLILLMDYFPGEYETLIRAALRNDLSPEQILVLLAIRKAENGPEGLELGVMSEYAKNTNLDKQAGACSYEIKRHCPDSSDESIIAFGERYCPVGAENDPDGLNKNWSRNVIFWVSYYKEVIRKEGKQ